MALTNINNLDGLDAVANIGADGETFLKRAIKDTFRGMREDRTYDLFIGQLQAEGFNVSLGKRFVLQSPTVKLEIFNQSNGCSESRAYLINGSAWELLTRSDLDYQA